MRTDADYRGLSFWHETVPGRLDPRPPLRGNVQADVAIVGAGFTGLWTALSLAAAIAMQRALFETVDEVGTACLAEGIDAHYRKGGARISGYGQDRRRRSTRGDRSWPRRKEPAPRTIRGS